MLSRDCGASRRERTDGAKLVAMTLPPSIATPVSTAAPAALRIIRDEHAALRAVLHSLQLMVERGPGDDPEGFFGVLRSMLFYIDEYPERRHHPRESNFLFPRVLQRAAWAMPVISRLEQEHVHGERDVRELQHLLTGWELVGESRRLPLAQAVHRYVDFYLEHMRLEETQVLPLAQQYLGGDEWDELAEVFGANEDPMTGLHPREPVYDRLFTQIVMRAPAPIGLG